MENTGAGGGGVDEMPEEKGVRDRKRVHDGRNEIVRAWITVDFVIPSN